MGCNHGDLLFIVKDVELTLKIHEEFLFIGVSLEWCDNREIKMVAELISLHIFPQLVGRISDTPVRKDIMWKILGFVGEKKSANQIFRSISLSAAWMLSPISSIA